MRAMPSPTSSTRPTSLESSWGRNCSSSVCRTETISSALNLITASRDELIANGVELRPDRRIVNVVADAHHHAAQEIRIDPHFQQGFLFERLPQLVQQALALIVGQGDGRPNEDGNPAGSL